MIHQIELGEKLYAAVEPHLYDDDHEWVLLEPNFDAWHALIDAYRFPEWIQRMDRRVISFPDTYSDAFIRDMVPKDWFTIMVSTASVEHDWPYDGMRTDLLIYGYQRQCLYRHDPTESPRDLLPARAHSPNIRAAFYEIPRELYL